ncbi:hypothetical protein K523DRAFT_107882 [Schizophyllum commune Tattone D]|nr:hypothetical protein K523DRAFT_107882 [Schizophyllum commune Tattone D]
MLDQVRPRSDRGTRLRYFLIYCGCTSEVCGGVFPCALVCGVFLKFSLMCGVFLEFSCVAVLSRSHVRRFLLVLTRGVCFWLSPLRRSSHSPAAMGPGNFSRMFIVLAPGCRARVRCASSPTRTIYSTTICRFTGRDFPPHRTQKPRVRGGEHSSC